MSIEPGWCESQAGYKLCWTISVATAQEEVEPWTAKQCRKAASCLPTADDIFAFAVHPGAVHTEQQEQLKWAYDMAPVGTS